MPPPRIDVSAVEQPGDDVDEDDHHEDERDDVAPEPGTRLGALRLACPGGLRLLGHPVAHDDVLRVDRDFLSRSLAVRGRGGDRLGRRGWRRDRHGSGTRRAEHLEETLSLPLLARLAGLHDPLVASGRFCINILYADQSEIAETFGGKLPNDERFSVGAWAASAGGLPFLREAQASIFCDLDLVTPYGTHSVVIGRISDILVAGHVAPLLYQDGRYTVGLGDGIDWVVPI